MFIRRHELAAFTQFHQQDAADGDDQYDSHSIPQHDPRPLFHQRRLNCTPLRDCGQKQYLAPAGLSMEYPTAFRMLSQQNLTDKDQQYDYRNSP